MEEIYLEIAQENPVVADAFVRDLAAQVEKLAALGLTGAPRDWIHPNLRAFPYRNRCFYFRVEEDRFILLRVLHGAQDVDRQFSDD